MTQDSGMQVKRALSNMLNGLVLLGFKREHVLGQALSDVLAEIEALRGPDAVEGVLQAHLLARQPFRSTVKASARATRAAVSGGT